MSVRLNDKDEICKIGDEYADFLSNNKDILKSKWHYVQNNTLDNLIKEKVGDIFELSRGYDLSEILKKVDDSELSKNDKNYTKKRILKIRNTWIVESYLNTISNVVVNPKDVDDWDFCCNDLLNGNGKPIEFDLKISVLPKNFETNMNNLDIIENPKQFIRSMFWNASDGARANPTYHSQSNRFFLVFSSKKDDNYFDSSININTEFLICNFKEIRKQIDMIFDEISQGNVLELNDVEYKFKSKAHKYDKVYSVICLIQEKEDGTIGHHIVKYEQST